MIGSKRQASRLSKVEVSGLVWTEFSRLAVSCGAVNLGQGMPSMKTPGFVQDACIEAIKEGHNQYARAFGHPLLVKELAARYSTKLGRHIDAMTQILVTNGASQALFNSFQAFTDLGDEVILIEPFFDIYEAQALVSGATIVSVPMKTMGNAWSLDVDLLEQAMSERTKILVLNSPHNPTGAMYSEETLKRIAQIVTKFPKVIVVCDEVYEYLKFGGTEHVHFASLPGMFDRTITVSSAGKTFSITGWKIGWAVGPVDLIQSMELIHRFVCFSVNTPGQLAVARALQEAERPYLGFDSYYAFWRHEYAQSREKLMKGLEDCGLKYYPCDGSFFITVDFYNVKMPQKYIDMVDIDEGGHVSHDWALCRFLTEEIRVAAIPIGAFYTHQHKHHAKYLVRLAFCKPVHVIEEAVQRLLSIRSFS